MDNPTLPQKENPLTLKYVKLMRLFLWIIGAWPGEVLGQTVPLIIRGYRKYAPIQGTVILSGQVYYLFKYFSTINFFIRGQCFIVGFLAILVAARGTLPNLKQYGVIVKRFFMIFHLIHYKHLGEYQYKMYTFIDKLSLFFTRYLMAMMVSGCVLFNLSPCYENYKNGAFTGERTENMTLELSVYFAFPGFKPTDHFIFVTFYNFYLSYNCASFVCSIDLLLSLMVFQIIGHIQVLRNDLESLPKPKKQSMVEFGSRNGVGQAIVEMYDEEENITVQKQLLECIEHHKMIVSFTDDLSNFFGPMLALNYLGHLVSCCLLLLECSQGDPNALLRFGPLTVIIFGQLIQISVTFEVVSTVSEKLPDSVYLVPWECMNTKNRRSVCILLNRVQTPIKVTAMGVTDVGVTTMTGILKTTFSYFTFLRSMDL